MNYLSFSVFPFFFLKCFLIACAPTDSNTAEFKNALNVFRQSYEYYSVSCYHTLITKESLFASSIESVRVETSIKECLNLMPDIISHLTKEYFNFSSEALQADTVSPVGLDDKAMCIGSFFQEGRVFEHVWNQRQSLVFFEFLFRFGIRGQRLFSNLNILIKFINPENFSMLYEIILKYFNPSTSTLPSIYFGNGVTLRIKKEFMFFQNNLHEKLISDLEVQTELYFDNISVNLMTIISLDMTSVLSKFSNELIQRSNMMVFLKSENFVTKFNEAKARGTLSSEFIDSFLARLIEDSLLLLVAQESKNLIYLHFAYLIEDLDYRTYTAALSPEASMILIEINLKYEEFNRISEKLTRLDTLKDDFINMTVPELIQFHADVSELVPIIQDCAVLRYLQVHTTITKLLPSIPGLISAALRDGSDQEINIQRYSVFVKLVHFSTSTDYIYSSTVDAFSKVLFFFTKKLSQMQLDSGVHQTNLSILQRLSKNGRMFHSRTHRLSLIKYLRSIDPFETVNVINNLAFTALRVRPNKLFGIADYLQFSYDFGISLKIAFSAFIVAEIEDYLLESSQIGIEVYRNRSLMTSVATIMKHANFSKTELFILKAFLVQNAESYDVIRLIFKSFLAAL